MSYTYITIFDKNRGGYQAYEAVQKSFYLAAVTSLSLLTARGKYYRNTVV